MLFKYILFVISVYIVYGYENPDIGFGVGSTVYNEIPCTAQGGTCVAGNQCPSGKVITIKGLCPVQQPNGVECCTRAPKPRIIRNTTLCRSKGGECTLDPCPPRLTFSAATDCNSGEKCCIYVK